MWSVGLRVQLQRCGSSREAKSLNGRGRKWFAWMNGTVEGKKKREKKKPGESLSWREEVFRLSEHRLGVRYECLVCGGWTYRCVAVGDTEPVICLAGRMTSVDRRAERFRHWPALPILNHVTCMSVHCYCQHGGMRNTFYCDFWERHREVGQTHRWANMDVSEA